MLKLAPVEPENFNGIDKSCRFCLYWQTTGSYMEMMETLSKQKIEEMKRVWYIDTRRNFGDCCFLVYLSNVPVGFIQCASPEAFPRIVDYSSGPPNNDAVFLACLYVFRREMHRRGIGTFMLESVIKNLRQRGFGAIETFARKDSENNPSGPLEFYLKHGFKVIAEKDEFPLVRLEI